MYYVTPETHVCMFSSKNEIICNTDIPLYSVEVECALGEKIFHEVHLKIKI